MDYTLSTQDLAELLGVTRPALRNYPDAKIEFGKHDLRKFMKLLLEEHHQALATLRAEIRKIHSDYRTREKNLAEKESNLEEFESYKQAALNSAAEQLKTVRAEAQTAKLALVKAIAG